MNDWLTLVLLSLGTYRLTRLTVRDTFPPILWARDRLVGGWRELTEKEDEQLPVLGISDPREWAAGLPGNQWPVQDIDGTIHRYVEPVSWSPYWLRELLSCPWCASGWLAGALVGGTAIMASAPLPGLLWLASWALGALLASQAWA